MFTVVCGITAVKIPVVTALVMTAMAQAMFHSLYNTSRGTIGKHCNFMLGRLTCHAPQHVVEESVSEHRSVVLVSTACLANDMSWQAGTFCEIVAIVRGFASVFLFIFLETVRTCIHILRWKPWNRRKCIHRLKLCRTVFSLKTLSRMVLTCGCIPHRHADPACYLPALLAKRALQ